MAEKQKGVKLLVLSDVVLIKLFEKEFFTEALEIYDKEAEFAMNSGNKEAEVSALLSAGELLVSLNKYQEADGYFKKCLNIALEIDDMSLEGTMYKNLGLIYQGLEKYQEAIEYYKKSLNIALELGDKSKEGTMYANLGLIYQGLEKYQEAIEYYKKSLNIVLELGDKSKEGTMYANLGLVYQCLDKYQEAIEYNEKSLNIALELGDKSKEGTMYANLGLVYQCLDKYQGAIEYYKKSLNIVLELGDKSKEGTMYANLGLVYQCLGKYQDAIEHCEKGLDIALELGDKSLEKDVCLLLGNVYQYLGKYQEAIEYFQEKSLKIALEVGDKFGEAQAFGNLGIVYLSVGKYQEANDYLEKSLNIFIEISDKKGEGKAHGNLGGLYQKLGKFEEAIECHDKCLNIALEVRDKNLEGETYLGLGSAYYNLGKYQKAINYYEKSLYIASEIGDKNGEGKAYVNLGLVYKSLAKFQEANKFYKKSEDIFLKIESKTALGKVYGKLGSVHRYLGFYQEAIEYHKKSLNIAIEVGDKAEKGAAYANQGTVYLLLGKYQEATEYILMGLNIALEMGDKRAKGRCYGCLGKISYDLGKYQEAIEYYEKSLRIATEIGDKLTEADINNLFGQTYYSLSTKVVNTQSHQPCCIFLSCFSNYYYCNYEESCKNNKEMSINYLKESVRCWDYVFEHSHEEDDSKISIFHTFIHAHKLLTTVLIETQQIEEALVVCDHGRARALGDILVSKYGLDKIQAVSRTPLEFPDVANILSNNNFYCILFFRIGMKGLDTWIITREKPLFFRRNKLEGLQMQCGEDKEDETEDSITQTLHQVVTDSFDKMKVRQTLKCENRSLESLWNADQDDDPNVGLQASPAGRHRTPDEETQNSSSRQEIDPLETLFNVLITPVIHELEQEEIVIIPHGPLYIVPFAALRDPKTGLFLSETKRIRLAPSLTTLKTLQECPSDYHCQKGALIVGDPDVGEVTFKGEKKFFTRLPSAKHEAKIIGANLNVTPFIGSQATKQMVKDKLQEGVSIIHIAAHGDSENGNIALAPPGRTEGGSTPKEEDYMLTMQEVQEIGVKAQLVVLSCCHSGRGEIKSEGVVGMSRAFLAAGARAVVASLWAVDDDATRNFMVSFYMYLKMGQSASKSLQQAMTDLREEGYYAPKYWAPFFLIGDDVTISV